jgi:hypothetical protein
VNTLAALESQREGKRRGDVIWRGGRELVGHGRP